MAEIGHNSSGSAAQLRELVERIQRLEAGRQELRDEAKTFTTDIATVYAVAKGQGYDTKMLRQAVKLANLDKESKEALGMYVDALDIFG